MSDQAPAEVRRKRVSPFRFMQEVREEGRKVTWPTRRETAITTGMVFVMVAIASVFFLVADQMIGLPLLSCSASGAKGSEAMNDTAETTTSTKPKRWYIVHAYSNFENKVADSIREQAKQRGLAEHIGEVLVPKEKVTEARRGRKVETERKFFPGYVLVKMDLTDEVYHLIKNTPKVTGFLGSDKKPMPISDAEAD